MPMAIKPPVGPATERVPVLEALAQDAVDRGAEMKTGGRRIGNKGNFYEPMVLSNVPKQARVMNEDPVLVRWTAPANPAALNGAGKRRREGS